MPGIVGLITEMPREWAEAQLSQMVATLRHESFYETGTWSDAALGVYTGWCARKGSFAESMPLRSENDRLVLVFSGEEFSDPDTATRLKQAGHSVQSSGPSYLVHLAEEQPDFPAGLNGRFHGILTDRNTGTAVLFNDRYGMHRIYYHRSKEAFYFAAEAKAILAVRPELRSIEPRSLGEFISCGCVLENRTLFSGIQVLPPASAWVIEKGTVQEKSYFNPKTWEEQEPLSPEAYYQELHEAFTRNLPRYFGGSERIAMSLTGGLDTRMIMASRKPAPGSLPCYSFGGTFRDSQDVQVARRVASACGQSLEVIPTGKEFLSGFSMYSERTIYLTDGCVPVGHAPDLYLNKKASAIAPVRMTGNYGGEVLRRVRAFKPVEPPPDLFRPELLSQMTLAKQTYAGLLGGHPLSFAVFKQAPWHHYGLQALEQTQLSVRSPFLDNDFVRTVFRAPQSTLGDNGISLRLIADGNPVLMRLRTDRGLAGNGNALTAGLTRRVLDFTFKAEYAYDYGMPQWLSRVDHVFQPLHLERLFLGRHKFYHFRIWYRDMLAEHVRQTLLDSRTLSRPYLNRDTVQAIVQGHLNGGQNYTTAIHKLLTLEHVHRLFVDSR
jgi:asparagine synthase (glutamine-hydrolysing)